MFISFYFIMLQAGLCFDFIVISFFYCKWARKALKQILYVLF